MLIDKTASNLALILLEFHFVKAMRRDVVMFNRYLLVIFIFLNAVIDILLKIENKAC